MDSENHPQSSLALSITKAAMVAPRSLPRPSGLPGRNGIAFERKLARALISDLSIPCRNFTQDLCHFNPTIESPLPQAFPQVIKTSHFYHNPWFKYRIFGQNSSKFCAPDFLIFLQKSKCEVFSENNPEKHLWDFASAKFFQNQNRKNTSNHFENQNNFEILKPDSKEPQDSKISDIDFKNQNATIIIIVEVKLTYTDSAWVKLQNYRAAIRW